MAADEMVDTLVDMHEDAEDESLHRLGDVAI